MARSASGIPERMVPMTDLVASSNKLDNPDGLVDDTIAWMKDASPEAVDYMLTREVGTGNGRSKWVWLRLANGDLILGTFPQGDTYMDVSEGGDAEMTYPPTKPEWIYGK
jgi:hypothetical protein